MSSLTAGLVLAGAASVAINSALVVQHGALVVAAPLNGTTGAQTVRRLLRSRRWVLGALIGYGGLALQILAMAFAPLWAVQAVLACGLLVALCGWSWLERRAPTLREGLAIGLLGGGLLGIVLAGVHPGAPSGAPLWQLLALAGVAAALAAALRRARLEAAAAGVLYAVTTVALASALASAPAAALATLAVGGLCAVAGLVRFQRALQIGSPARVVLLMTTAMNGGAVLGGAVLLGTGGLTLPAAVALAALCGAGAVAAPPGSVPGDERLRDGDPRLRRRIRTA